MSYGARYNAYFGCAGVLRYQCICIFTCELLRLPPSRRVRQPRKPILARFNAGLAGKFGTVLYCPAYDTRHHGMVYTNGKLF